MGDGPSNKRKTWNKHQMIAAVNAVRAGNMGYKLAAKQFGIPKGTLERYVKKREMSADELVSVPLGRKTVLGADLEKELVQYCIEMDARFYGLRRRDIKSMAFQLAIRNGIQHPFSVKNKTAGKKWLASFLKRHPQLSFRSPQNISHARVKGFNPESVKTFFELYEPEFQKINGKPNRLYNVDETGISVVQHKAEKVISVKGKKEVAALTSAERGSLVTIVTCMNAVDSYVPPMIVWPRKNMKLELMDGAPAGAIWGCHPTGWIQTDLFTVWFDHFIQFTKPSVEDPVLLLLDGHYSHTRNIDIINKARDNNVKIICLPPHSSHKMQPLDVGFMKPLKSYYSTEIENWLKNHPARVVTPFVIAKLFATAYNRAATMEISVNSFRKTGLFPLNSQIFRDYDFSIHVENGNTAEELPTSPGSGRTEVVQPIAGPSHVPVSPSDIRALPTVTAKSSNRSGRACVITSSPYKSNLELSLNRKSEKKKKQEGGMHVTKVVGKTKGVPNKKSQRKRPLEDSSSEDSDLEFIPSSSEDEDYDEDAECLFCGCLFSSNTHGEQWVQCTGCYRWAHEHCGAIERMFLCPTCVKKQNK